MLYSYSMAADERTLLSCYVMLLQGVPEVGASIAAAQSHHYDAWLAGQHSGKPWHGITVTTTADTAADAAATADSSNADSYDASSSNMDTTATAAAEAVEELKVIGLVTSGGYSHARSVGIALALCEAAAVACAMQRGQVHDCSRSSALVLVRNADSNVWRPGNMIILHQ
jgi:glycine cleavage system aminomethyltransferase T